MPNHSTVEVNERASSYHILKSNKLTTGFLFVSSELAPVQQRSTPKSTIGKLLFESKDDPTRYHV